MACLGKNLVGGWRVDMPCIPRRSGLDRIGDLQC
jgi:hypothetical protein